MVPGCLPGAILPPHSHNARFLSVKYNVLQCALDNVPRNFRLFATVKRRVPIFLRFDTQFGQTPEQVVRHRHAQCCWVGASIKDA